MTKFIVFYTYVEWVTASKNAFNTHNNGILEWIKEKKKKK